MRQVLIGFAMIAVGVMLHARPAAAQDYPWCLYEGKRAGGYSCGFVSFEQCMQTQPGIGGICARNPAYVTRDNVPAPSRRSSHRRH